MKQACGIGVVGLGGAGSRHADALASGQIKGAWLAGICDEVADRRSGYDAFSTASFDDLLMNGDIKGVVIATPHRNHVELAEKALRAGRHVLAEKPLGVHKAECERLLSEYAALGPERPEFGVVHDYRVDPRYRWLKPLLLRGELGRIERVVWQATDFFRTEAYYAASPWRGTYDGEGGGVLVNQAPHVFDTLVWLFGKPRRVLGSCRFGRFHDIEVEDDVTAELCFASGTTALVVVATGEAPGTNRLEISGDRGRIVIEGSSALIHRNREAASQFRARESSGRPLSDVERVELGRRAPTASMLLENFVKAIGKLEPLAVPASEAASAVEVANAVAWSSWLERPIELPLDALGFERALSIRAAEGTKRSLVRLRGVLASS